MKKFTAIILALLLMFSLSITAFAATDTPVKLKVADTQISVAVPVEIVATVNWTTGALSFPEASSTLITNNSVFPIKVASIVCVAQTGWTLAASGGSTKDTIVATISPDTGTTTLPLLATAQITSGAVWNMAAKNEGNTTDSLPLTLAGAIENADTKTAALGTEAATAFTITFTVAAGANADT